MSSGTTGDRGEYEGFTSPGSSGGYGAYSPYDATARELGGGPGFEFDARTGQRPYRQSGPPQGATGEPGYEFDGRPRIDPAWRQPGRRNGRSSGTRRAGQGRASRDRVNQDEARSDDETASTLSQFGAEVRKALRLRGWITKVGVPILAMMAVGIAVTVVVGANGGSAGGTPPSLSAGFPPAALADADFTTGPTQAGRGISQPLSSVATQGATTVAVGAESGGRINRPRFFASSDGGRTWQPGQLAGDPPPGHTPSQVAGGPGGWVAVGPDSLWTSKNGQSWTLVSATGLPQQAGDKVLVLAHAGSGFLAAGTSAAGAVIWLSANGTSWQRFAGSQLAAAGIGGQQAISYAAASPTGNVIVVASTSAAWRSTSGGTRWSPVTVRAGGGRQAISGLAMVGTGFAAISPAGARAAVYVSPDGQSWRKAAVLRAANGAPLRVLAMSGGPNAAVVTASEGAALVAFISATGSTWRASRTFGAAARVKVAAVAVTRARRAIVAGATTGSVVRVGSVLTVVGATGKPRQGRLPAPDHEKSLAAVAASGATQVAVGSADGFPAAWRSSDGGSTWRRDTGATLRPPGVRQLTSVVHGNAGWLAVGSVLAAAPRRPVVLGSRRGATWTSLGGQAAFRGAGLVTAQAAAGPGGYVIIGSGQGGGAAWWSANLRRWQRAGDATAGALDGAGGRQLSGVTAAGKGFAAVGSAGNAPAAWLSASGRTWRLVKLTLPPGAASAKLQYVAATATRLVAAGMATDQGGTQVPFAAISADGGANWTEQLLPVPSGTASVTALTAAGGSVTVAGSFGPSPAQQDVVLWTLGAQNRWTAATPAGRGLSGAGIQQLTALTAVGSTLTGVGFADQAGNVQSTIWQSPVRA